MKNLTLFILCLFLVVACKKKAEVSEHAASHSASILFDISNSSNISHFNVYESDDLQGQMTSGSTPTANQYSFDIEDIVSHPYDLNFAIEPIFLDSSNADVQVNMKIFVDGTEVATSSVDHLLYGEMASLAYSGN